MARRLWAGVVLALVATGCMDREVLAPDEVQNAGTVLQFDHRPGHSPGAPTRNGLLADLPVTGNDGAFEGLLNITSLGLDDGQLLASGTLTGTVTDAGGTVTDVSQQFTDVAVNLAREGAGSSGGGGACSILNLQIPGGLELDLLGLVVDLAPVQLELRAERGSGNLLGNLLCALVGLLDIPAAVNAVLNMIDRINALL